MTGPEWPEVYRKLGVAPIINAQSWVTALGGSIMRPEVLRAMDEAAGAYVDMMQLNHDHAGPSRVWLRPDARPHRS